MSGPADKMECKDEIGLSLDGVKKKQIYCVTFEFKSRSDHTAYNVKATDLHSVMEGFASDTDCTSFKITKETS